MRWVLPLVLIACLTSAPAQAATKMVTIKGSHEEILTVWQTSIKSGAAIRVKGAHFDETVGIYLAFCVLPKQGDLPTPCGGGINQTGIGDASYWISSNPPPYGVGLADEYRAGGRFSYTMHISSKIGKFDCTKVRCAVTVRTDHTREGDRSYDMFVPIKFLTTRNPKE